MQRLRIRYAKCGPMRFVSHRDFARALERAIQRAGIPIAYSQGFTPHPKISYASAAPTGVASFAEYLELGLRSAMDPAAVTAALDAALPGGLDVVETVVAATGGLADRINTSAWQVELPGQSAQSVAQAVEVFLGSDQVLVERETKAGIRRFDAREPVIRLAVISDPALAPSGVGAPPCAILDLVVRHVTPTVRPDDVLTGLCAVGDLVLSVPPRVTRLAQGTLSAESEITDPLAADRDLAGAGASPE